MTCTKDAQTSTSCPSPDSHCSQAEEFTKGAAPGPPSPPPLRETSSSDSAISQASWNWSQTNSSTGETSPTSSIESSCSGKARYRQPSIIENGVRSAPQAAAALSRRAFAKRTAIKFQLIHPTSHAICLNFPVSSTTCRLQGSRLYADPGTFDIDSEDHEEDPLVFDSVSWCAGPDLPEERYDVYLFQSGRFSLKEVENDE